MSIPSETPSAPADGPALVTPLPGISLAGATWGLFAGLSVLLAGVGLYATLIGVRAELESFNTAAIGVIGASYYAGFVLGSRIALKVVGSVGHIRVYGALCALLGATTLLSGLVVHPVVWIVLRLLAGAAIAGVFVVAESWLNQLANNQNRARVLATYAMVTIITYGIGQVVFSLLDPTTLTAFTIAGIAIMLAVLPVSLSAVANPPAIAEIERLPLKTLFANAPTGVVTAFATGAVMGAITAFAPVFASRSGITATRIGLFTAMPALGSLLLQVPIAALSDRHDRRRVGVVTAAAASGASALLLVSDVGGLASYLAMVLLGGTMYPLYSIAGAYTNDRLRPELLMAAAAQLVVLFGVGAFIGPLVMALAMGLAGTTAYPLGSALGLGAISLFLAVRILQHPSAERANPEQDIALDTQVLQIPATAVAMGRRLRYRRPIRNSGQR